MPSSTPDPRLAFNASGGDVLESAEEIVRRSNPLGIPRTAEEVAAFEALMPHVYNPPGLEAFRAAEAAKVAAGDAAVLRLARAS